MRTVTENEFAEAVSNGLVMVDFYADWCGPCKMMSPVLEQLQEEFHDNLKVIKVNVDNDMNLARQFGIMNIPNIYLFRDGKPVNQIIGYHPYNDLKRFVMVSVSSTVSSWVTTRY